MPKKRKTHSRSTPHRRNSNKQHPKHFAKVYWPYMPIIAIVAFGMFFGGVNPSQRIDNPATLAYATEMGVGALLSHTNQKRSANGLGPLTLNSKLNSSAQAKANDMVADDYWSHNTPGGQEPWIFFDAAGYSYQKAGENLAYGFDTSSATIVGWMNSPSHRANILDTTYTEVGFGFKNSPNFVGTGQETVVVAHYAKPLNSTPAPAPTSAPAAEPQSTPQSLPSQTSTDPAPEPDPVVVEEPEPEPEPLADDRYNQPITSEAPVPDEVASTNITRLQSLTQGDAPWSALALSVGAFSIVLLWIIKHTLLVKKFLWRGEHFVAHHPFLDLFVVAVAALAVYLSQSSGVVL